MIEKLINATKNSISGLRYLFQERAFVQELFFIPLLIFIFCSGAETLIKIYCLASYLLILITEALNTAIEAVVDRISLEKHELSKKAKDIGSAAVLVALLNFGAAILFASIEM